MRHKRTLTALSAVAVGVIPVIGVNATSYAATVGAARKAPVVNLTWSTWGNPGELKRFYQLTDAYNKAHPQTHWTLIPIPSTGYLQKLQTELAGGKAPDVFYMGDGDVATVVKDNVLLDMTPYFSTGPIKHKISDWPNGVWGGAKVGNDVYGIAPDCNPLVLYFNKTLLKQAGIKTDPIALYNKGKWTWNAFVKMTSQLKLHGKYGYIFDNAWTNEYTFVWGNGGKVYDAKGNFIANKNPKALQTFRWLANNVKNGNFTYSNTLPKGQGDDAMFMSNQAGFVAAGRWYAPEFNAAKNLNYDVVPFPTPSGKIGPSAIALAYVGINKHTKYPQQAWDFLDYFVSDPGVVFRLKDGGNAVPALAHGPDWVGTQGNPPHQKFILQERQIGYPLEHEEAIHPGLTTTITNDLDLAFLGKESIDKALAQVASDVAKVNK